MALLARGNERRVVARMAMNARSSRGHAIFTLHVKEVKEFEGSLGSEKHTKMHMVCTWCAHGPMHGMRRVVRVRVRTMVS